MDRDRGHNSVFFYCVALSLALHGVLLLGFVARLPRSEVPRSEQWGVIEIEPLPVVLDGDRPSVVAASSPGSTASDNIPSNMSAPPPTESQPGVGRINGVHNNPGQPTEAIAPRPTTGQTGKTVTPPSTQPGRVPAPKPSNAPGATTTGTTPITPPSPGTGTASGNPPGNHPSGTGRNGNNAGNTGHSSTPVAPPAPKPVPPPSPPPAPVRQGLNCVQGCGDRQDQLNGQTGIAFVRLEINPSGQVVSASIATSSGNASLDSKAIAAARQMGFNARESTTNEFRTVKINLGT